ASSWLLGRGSASAIAVAEPSVSRRHAVIAHRGHDEFFVMDVGSRNGTQVDNRAIVPGTRHRLRDGTLLQLGDMQVEFFVTQTRGEIAPLDIEDTEGPTEATGLGPTW
ncbi:MAG: FHA domain-containing protein, partial [Cyanobacteria bacterium P01_A01_bin.135]